MSGALDKQIDGDHYKEMSIQPWTIIEKNGLDYFEGAVLKYLLRWRHKDGLVDLDKIIHYVERIKELALAGHYGIKFIEKPVDPVIDFTSPVQGWKIFSDMCYEDKIREFHNAEEIYKMCFKKTKAKETGV